MPEEGLTTFVELKDHFSDTARRILDAGLSLKGGMEGLAIGVAGLAAGFGIIAGAGIKAAMGMETLQLRLYGIYGNGKQAADALKFITYFAGQSSTTLQDAAEAFITMGARGITPTLEKMKALNIIALMMGRSTKEAAQAVMQASVGEWEMIREMGITRQMVAAKAPGAFSGDTVKDAKAVVEAILSIAQGRFGGVWDQVNGKFIQLMTNLQTAVTNLFAAIGVGIEEPIKRVTDVLVRLGETAAGSDWLKKLKKSMEETFSVANVKSFFAWLLATFRTLQDAITNIAKVLVAVANASVAWKVALVAIAGAVAAIYVIATKGLGLKDVLLAAGAGALVWGILSRLPAAKADLDKLMGGLSATGLPKEPPPVPGEKDGGAGAKGALDKMAEALLGKGGVLSRIGVRSSELGGPFGRGGRDRYHVDVTVKGVEGPLRTFVKDVAVQVGLQIIEQVHPQVGY